MVTLLGEWLIEDCCRKAVVGLVLVVSTACLILHKMVSIVVGPCAVTLFHMMDSRGFRAVIVRLLVAQEEKGVRQGL